MKFLLAYIVATVITVAILIVAGIGVFSLGFCLFSLLVRVGLVDLPSDEEDDDDWDDVLDEASVDDEEDDDDWEVGDDWEEVDDEEDDDDWEEEDEVDDDWDDDWDNEDDDWDEVDDWEDDDDDDHYGGNVDVVVPVSAFF